MKIFLSWSGAQSRKLAEALHWFLPHVLQNVKPFISSKGIGPGEKWPNRLSQALEEYDFGVVCLTSTNTAAPWLLFECGALAKKDISRLIPVFCDMVERDLHQHNPLTLFQHVYLNEEGIRSLVQSINDKLGDNKLNEKKLDEAFATWWRKFAPKIEEIIASRDEPKKVRADTAPAIEEILQHVRDLTRRMAIDEIGRWVFADAAPSSAELTLLAGLRKHLNKQGISRSEFERLAVSFWEDHMIIKHDWEKEKANGG